MGNLEHLENEIVNFREAFCPYGYSEIKAVSRSINASFDSTWVFHQIEFFYD